MADSQPPVYQFLLYAPDKTDAGSLARRLAVREKHLEAAQALSGAVTLKLGRALLSPESIAAPGAPQTMVGSVLIYQAASLDAVRAVVERDVYYTNGVWDPERLVILPFAGLALPE
ncbi:hypothetical protein DFH11DRAFT_1729555 [Phellopilus nigrolimitatus]|nr:hypothetical protein DFH11DRAFT_1729555 [Phellopilus nigrolimitatus]